MRNTMKNSILLTIVLFLFAACEKEDKSNSYWQSNDLKKMQLKGNVKSVEYPDECGGYELLEFDTKGRISKLTSYDVYCSHSAVFENKGNIDFRDKKEPQSKIALFAPSYKMESRSTEAVSARNDAFHSVITFHYNSAGQLTSYDEPADQESETFQYGNHGAHVPSLIDLRLLQFEFKKNLSVAKWSTTSLGYEEFRKDSVIVSGNEMKICTSYDSGYRDTTYIKLNSAKYPVSLEGGGLKAEYSYYSNNMLKKMTVRTYIYEGERTYYYKSDNEYLLLEREESREFVTVYLYNENKDLLSEEETFYGKPYGKIEYSYEYDQKGNWIKRMTKETSPESSDIYEETETRTIVYY